MPDDKQTEQEPAESEKPKKGKRRYLRKILGVLGVLFLLAAFAGGVVAGPRVGARFRIPGYVVKDPPAPPPPDAPPPVGITKSIDPLIVDIKSEDGQIHHIKVGIAVELHTEVKEEEFNKYVPRARDAALSYLRSLAFTKATDPKEFDVIRKELGQHVIKAVGDERAQRIVFTDFVVQ